MNIKVFQNRKIEKDYFYNEGTQNENSITVLTFEVPLGYEDFSKRIVFITEDGNFWDYIPENKYEIKNNITKYGTVEAYLWLTKDEQDFRSQKFELNFYENENADNMAPSEEQVDGFNTLIAELEVKINEINELKPELDKALEKIENYDTDLQGIKNDIAERLTEEDAKKIFYTETEVDEMIKEIQETNEYQSEIIDQFKNEFKQITVSGDSIYITDAAELPIDLVPCGEPTQVVIPEELGTTVEGETVTVSDGDVDKEVKATVNGNSYQETTEGYNILDLEKYYYNESGSTLNGATAKVEKGILKIDGTNATATATAKSAIFYKDNENVSIIPAGTYYFGVNTNGYYEDELDKLVQFTIGVKTLTKNYILTQWYYPCGVGEKVERPLLISKDSTKTTYEPYTNGVATPNTNHKQDIEVITECSLVQRGKNEYCNLKSDYHNRNNTDYEIIDNNTLKVFTTQSTIWGFLQFKKKGFKKGQTYKFSCEFNNSNTSITNSYITLRGVNTNTSYYANTINNGQEIEFTPDDTELYVRFNCTQATAMENTTVYSKIQISEVGGEYEPYKEPIVHSIDLAGNSLAKVGEIKDILNIGVDGSVSIEKSISKYEFTGNETWSVAGDKAQYIENAQIILGYQVKNDLALCNVLKGSTNYETRAGIDKISTQLINNTQSRIWISPNVDTTKLVGNYVYLARLLAEKIPLPSIEPIELFEGTNIFELVTNLGTTLAVTYNYVTPSPSIDRPSEIFTVQGDYETEKVNENLIDIPDVPETTRNGITYSVSNNKFRANGTATTGTSISIMKDFKFKKGTYTHSINKQKQDVYFSFDNLSDNMIGYIKTRTFELKEDINYSKYHIWINEGVTFNNEEFEIQVQTGSTATPFTPHQSTTLPLTVGNELLGEIVTLTKEEAKQLNLDGAGKYIRTDYGRLTDISRMNNYITPNVPQGFNIRIPNIDTDNANLLMKSNKQKINTYYGTNWKKYDGNLFGLLYPTDNPKAVYFNKLMENQTIEEVKKWWADNGIELIYPLATPTYEKITDETVLAQLKEYDKQIAFFRVNNINTYLLDDTNAAPLKIHATYSKSNKLTIQSLEDRLASLESQVTNLQDNQI